MLNINIKNKEFYSKSSQGKTIFKDVDLKLSKGLYILKGLNGSGKTTFLNMIYNLDKDYEGEISILGNNITDMDNNILRTQYITYVKQEFNLFDQLTPLENIKLLSGENSDSKLEELTKILKVEDILNKKRKMKKFSEGQKQKIKLLIGLLSNTPILLLDEPNNNLDLETTENLAKYIEKNNKLVIIVSHTFEEFLNIDNYNILEIQNEKIIQTQKTINMPKSEEAKLDVLEIQNKKISKQILKKLKKTTKLNRVIIYCFIVILVYLSLLSLAFLSNAIDSMHNGSMIYMSDNVLTVTAPISSGLVENFGTKESVQTTPYYFTQEDYEMLKNQDNVKYVEPIVSVFDGYVSGAEYEYFIDLTSFNLEKYKEQISTDDINKVNQEDLQSIEIESIRCMNTKRVSDNYEGSCGEVVVGEFPKENSDEVALSPYMALYFADQQNLDDVKQIIGKKISFMANTVTSTVDEGLIKGEKKQYTYTVSGIVEPLFNEDFSIIYPYDEESDNIKTNQTWVDYNFNQLNALSHVQRIYKQLGLKEPTMQDIEPLENNAYPAFYVELDSYEDVENLSKKIQDYDPYIEIDSVYNRENTSNARALKGYIQKQIIHFIILFILLILLIILLIKYYYLSLEKNINKLKFFGFNNEEVKKYIFKNNITLFKGIIIENIALIIIFTIAFGFYWLQVIVPILFTLVILLVITIFLIYKHYKNKY